MTIGKLIKNAIFFDFSEKKGGGRHQRTGGTVGERAGDGTGEPIERCSGREDDSSALKNAGGLHPPCTPLPCV